MGFPRAESKLDAKQAPNVDGACMLQDHLAILAKARFELSIKSSGILCSATPFPFSYQVQYTRVGQSWQGAEMASYSANKVKLPTPLHWWTRLQVCWQPLAAATPRLCSGQAR